VFREIVGDNVIAYVNRCKIRDAKKSLIDTNKAVKEISFEYGFENETYFYTLFKKLEGITPSEFRVQHRKLIQ
jgi:YesN/AraC family two-component response regulator